MSAAPDAPAGVLAELPFLRSVGFVVTYRCQVRCPHCVIRAGPDRREQLLADDGLQWIDRIAAYRDGWVGVLALTGGEPFFDVAHLAMLTERAALRGLIVSAVTNAFWAATEEKALGILARLPALRILTVSADAYHQRSIPYERVVHAIRAASRLGIGCNVNVCTEDESDPEYLALRARLSALVGAKRINVAVTFPAGRAAEMEAHHPMQPDVPRGACPYAAAPIVFPDGRVIACIGPVIDLPMAHPLFLGTLRLEPAAAIFDRAEKNLILHAIRVWGPQRIVQWLREHGHGDMLPRQWVKNSICCACLEIFANPALREPLSALARDAELAEVVPYARAYYLGEE